jgi:beta-N-acetylhexosaminidase
MMRLATLCLLAVVSTPTVVHAQDYNDPAAAGFSVDSLENLRRFLQQKATEHVFPGAVLVVGRERGVAYATAVGVYGDNDRRPVNLRTMYDLASLTKVVGLTTATYLLLQQGRIDLDDPVQRYVPEFTGAGKEGVTLRHLLTHTSGLPAWLPLHLITRGRREALERVLEEPLENPPGTTYVYSDLGAMVMMLVVESVTGEPLDAYLAKEVFGPLGMEDTEFNPDSSLRDRIAPTENDSWRGRVLRGEVHDENAFHLGGVSGHAGLFSTGRDLAKFAQWMLSVYHAHADSSPVELSPARLREYTTLQPGPEDALRAIGWQKPSPGGGNSAGSLMSPESFGHTGFTGTSIWIDPTKDVYVILLTNRVHPTRENQALLPLRGIITDMVMRALLDGGSVGSANARPSNMSSSYESRGSAHPRLTRFPVLSTLEDGEEQ